MCITYDYTDLTSSSQKNCQTTLVYHVNIVEEKQAKQGSNPYTGLNRPQGLSVAEA
jgi:hypothetical protein